MDGARQCEYPCPTIRQTIPYTCPFSGGCESTMSTVSWSQLPADLLMHIIENQLPSVDDVIVFSSVCESWNRAAHACDKSQLAENRLRQMPWLMLTDGNDDEVYSDTGSYRAHMFADNVMGLSDVDSDYSSTDMDEDQLQGDENELLVDSYYYSEVKDSNRNLLNLSNNRSKCYNLNIPEVYGKACWGSRHGWIVTLGLNRQMHLFNPLTKAQLPLPSQTTFRYPWKRARDQTIRLLFLSRAVVLRVPQDDNSVMWLVVAIYRGYALVAIASPGDASWMHISWHDGLHIFMDVIYSDKLKSLLFIDSDADLYRYDIHNSVQPQEFKVYLKGPEAIIDELPSGGQVEPYMHLVESVDDLFVVARYKRRLSCQNDYSDGDIFYRTENFRVFRHSFPTMSWEELSDLGNFSLFVGGNETICIDALDAGCKSNSIYFCDDESEFFRYNREEVGGHDLGVFNLSNKTIESIYDGNNLKSSYCCPFWFSPSI